MRPTLLFLVLSTGQLFAEEPKVRGPRPPFVPTPQDVVEKMLELAQVNKADRVYDLGCGDGRIVVTAAKKYGCQAVGIDFDGECARLAWDNVKRNEVEKLAEIVQGDFFKVDWSRADVVTLYLFPATNVRLVPYFDKLRPGARIVSHAADMKGFKPDRVVRFTSKEDGQERSLYVWVTPLRQEPAAADLDEKAPGHWPQWRGPKRDGVSDEKGLLQEWPLDGPPLLWKAEGIGVGYSPVSVADGRIYSLGFRKPDEYAFALDGNGKELWATRIGPFKESGMNFLSQRQPTADEDRIYAVTNQGELNCLEGATGKELWRKSYREDFGAKLSGWGCCDYPLVDGDRLICCPGGETSTMVALDKRTGELIWKCPIAGMTAAEHSALVVAEVGGVRQYVKLFGKGFVGVSLDGKLLWRYNPVACQILNVPTPLAHGDRIFATSGYGTGAAMLKLVPKDGGIQVQEVYRSFKNDSWNFGPVRVGNHIYAAPYLNRMACIEWGTDKVLWEVKSRRTPAMLYADGHLICRQEGGDIKLVEASAADYREKGSFKIEIKNFSMPWSMPVIAGGRLYVRDQATLYCYNLKEKR